MPKQHSVQSPCKCIKFNTNCKNIAVRFYAMTYPAQHSSQQSRFDNIQNPQCQDY